MDIQEQMLILLIGALISGFIGFGAAYGIYLIQKKDEKKKNEAENDLVSYFNKIIAKSIKNLKSQVKYYAEFTKNSENNKYRKNEIRIVFPYYLDKIERYDIVEMFYAFRKKHNITIDNYFKLIEWLLYLKTVINGSIKDYDKYTDRINFIEERFKEKVEDISDNIALFMKQLITENGDKVKSQDNYKFLDEMLGKFIYLKDNNEKLEELDKEFLYPILKGIVGNTNREKYTYAEFLMINTKKTRVLLNDITFINDAYSKKFEGIGNDINNNVNEIEKLIKTLNLDVEL